MLKKSLMSSALLASFILLGQSPRDWRASHEVEILSEYRELLAIPNIARNPSDMRRNAEMLQRMFAKRGVPLQLLEVPDAPPALFGELRVPGATRTLVFYAHYDGQPVTPSRWLNGDPFQPELRDASGKLIPWGSVTRFDPEWRLHARSAADDKAPIMAFLVALDALRAAGKTPTVNLKFFLDGEEELLSPHLQAIIDKYKPLLSSDGWVIFDGPTHPSRRQLISFGSRGNFNLELTVYGPNEELHSGHYGNWAPNPALILVHLLASMKDEKGRVLIRGFYDDVIPLNAFERRAIEAMPDMEAGLRKELELGTVEVPGRKLQEAVHVPALNIQGLGSAGVGAERRSVIPSSATAFLGVRLVKGMQPAKTRNLVLDHLRRQGCFVTEVEPDAATKMAHSKVCYVSDAGQGGGQAAVREPLDSEFAVGIVQAVESVRGAVIRQPTLGGTLPLAPITEGLRAPVVLLPIVNHDNNQHTHNENLRLQNLWDGIETISAVMTMK